MQFSTAGPRGRGFWEEATASYKLLQYTSRFLFCTQRTLDRPFLDFLWEEAVLGACEKKALTSGKRIREECNLNHRYPAEMKEEPSASAPRPAPYFAFPWKDAGSLLCSRSTFLQSRSRMPQPTALNDTLTSAHRHLLVHATSGGSKSAR